MKGPFRNKQGSSLLEVVVAIAVLGLMVAPVCSSLVLSHRLNAEAEKVLEARLLLESTVEQLMGEGIDKNKIKVVNSENYYEVEYAQEAGVKIRTDSIPERIEQEQEKNEDGTLKFDEYNIPVMREVPIELWYNVTVSIDDIEIKTVIKAAPEYVDDKIPQGSEDQTASQEGGGN